MNTETIDRVHANKRRQQALVETLQNRGEIDRAGVAGVKAIFGATRQAFPDHDAKIVHQIAEGDLVATYKTLTGTHRGDLFGLPPTGKRATIQIMDFVRYRDGKVAEHWGLVDMAGLMQQLGIK